VNQWNNWPFRLIYELCMWWWRHNCHINCHVIVYLGSHVIVHVGSHVIVHVDQNVDKPQRDTWTNCSVTRGPFRSRHVDKPQRDTWRCVKEPRHHIHISTCLATSAANMGRATWHPLPWPISWPFSFIIEEIHFYDKKRVGHGKVPLIWPKWLIGHGRPNVMELLWPIQFGHKLVIKKCSVTKFACTVTKPFGHW
jgi:hypothetical protein